MSGFTLLELLLVVGIILIIGVPVAFFSTHFIYQSSVRDASEGLISMLHQAQIFSMLGKENSTWGVKKESGKVILFRGENFATRATSFDQELTINPNIEIGGFDEIVFSAYEGLPSQALPLVTIVWGGVSDSLNLNSEGVVE